MSILVNSPDLRIIDVHVDAEKVSIDLMDGRSVSVPLAWYPRLFNATPEQREHWQISGGGHGIHWPEIDEDLSSEGMLQGAPAPHQFVTAE